MSHHMGTKDAGWGQPGDHYYGGACRRCGKHKGDPGEECHTTFEGMLQHLMDTHEDPGMGQLYASDLFALFQLLGRERKAMQDKIAAQDEQIKSLVGCVNGMADALREARQRLGLSPPDGPGEGGSPPPTS